MTDLYIECPECGHSISTTAALSAELKKQLHDRERAHVTELQAREQDLCSREVAIEKRSEQLDMELKRRLQEQYLEDKAKLEDEAKQLAKSFADSQISAAQKTYQFEIELMQEKLDALTTDSAELARLRRQQESAEIERRLETEKLRTDLQEAHNKEIRKVRSETENLLKEKLAEQALQHERSLDAARKSVGILEQGSQQAQGEALENSIEDYLQAKYPLDEVKPVPKGVSGADCLVVVNGKTSIPHGSILVEAKNTKRWGKDWVDKLRRDSQDAKVDFPILISKALPPDCSDYCVIDGVQIVSPDVAPVIIATTRQMVSQRHQERSKASSRASQKDRLFDFIHSPEFYMQVQIGVATFKKLKAVTEDQRDFMRRSWAKSDRLIEQITGDIMATLGDFEAILEAKAAVDLQPELEHHDLH